MAEDLVLGLKAELDEGSLSEIQGKIDKIKNGKENKITFKIDNEVNTQISNLQKSLDAISKKPYKIDIQVNHSALNDLKNISSTIEQINRLSNSININTGAGTSKLPAWNKPKGGFNYLKDYRDELQKQVDTYVKDLSTQGAKNIRTSISATYDKDGTPNYKGIVQYENAVGKATQAVMELDKATNVWRVNSTKVSTDYTKQAKALEDVNKYITEQQIKIDDLTSKAFNQSNPLTGDFEKTARASITAWKAELDAIDKSSGTLAADTTNKIRELEATAKRVVQEQQKAQYQGQKLTANSFETDKALAATNLDTQIEKYKQAGIYTEELKAKFDGLKQSLESVSDQSGLKQWNEDLKQATAEVTKFQAELATKAGLEKFETDLKKSENTLQGFAVRYKEAFEAHPELATELDTLRDRLNSVDSAAGLKNVNNDIAEFGQRVRNAQSELDPFIGRAKSLSQVLQQNFGGVGQYMARFTSTFYIISKGIQTIKSMVNEVKALDTSLVELQKVTDLTGTSLANFTNKAYNIGKEVGRTGKDVIDAVTTFSRAGYDLQESTNLAQSALVMTNVGVDIPNTAAAASDMISILKAFGKQADESMSVIDKLYNVANKEPLDFGNLTQMLVTAGGTLAQTGTTLEETMGLLTGAYSTLRDTSVSNG